MSNNKKKTSKPANDPKSEEIKTEDLLKDDKLVVNEEESKDTGKKDYDNKDTDKRKADKEVEIKKDEVKEDDTIAVVEVKKGDNKSVFKVDTTDDTDNKAIEKLVKAKSKENDPIYQVRLDWKNIVSDKGGFTDLNRAIRECNNYPGYKVFDETGSIVHVSIMPLAISNTHSVQYAGKKYILNETKIYSNGTVSSPKAIVSGVYYLFDGVDYNGRYRIVDKRYKVNGDIKSIVGYITLV